ncbi:MAG: hypothetical protein ACYTG0_14200 [Planctomycetota bacterium]|jgi:hypothetical protein
MKPALAARYRNRPQSAAGVSLFPFLAVLISTMGALILLLVVIARQAQIQAADDVAVGNAEVQDDLDDARDMAQLEIDEYKKSRDRTRTQLSQARLALGHVEDHARQLAQQLARFEATGRQLESIAADDTSRRQELESELRRLRSEIAESESDLDEARRKAAERPRSYAVVLYQGPHQTRRRPIYLECRDSAVVLQPEGIVLSERDFTGPLGPGNPLDVALRAIREYWQRRRQSDVEDLGEPYPLLLIRPGGVEAYYAARAAMKSWAADIGYQLIDEEWNIEYPPADPGLAEDVRRAIEIARARQRRLVAAAPRQFGGGSGRGFVASPSGGGLVPAGGSRGEPDSGHSQQRPFQPSGHRPSSIAGGQGRHAPPTSTAAQDAPNDTSYPYPRPKVEGKAGTQAPMPGASNTVAEASAMAGKRLQSLAQARGHNWGLPNAASGSVPITAPIHVDCYPDRLVLVPEKGLGSPRSVPIGRHTVESVDQFVSAVWEYMERWGAAGNGMYWQPVLDVRVTSGAETRYRDLEILLDRSGLELRRSGER